MKSEVSWKDKKATCIDKGAQKLEMISIWLIEEGSNI